MLAYKRDLSHLGTDLTGNRPEEMLALGQGDLQDILGSLSCHVGSLPLQHC